MSIRNNFSLFDSILPKQCHSTSQQIEKYKIRISSYTYIFRASIGQCFFKIIKYWAMENFYFILRAPG